MSLNDFFRWKPLVNEAAGDAVVDDDDPDASP
eukprot:CAMPEP_0113513294 /NCGR_PEP_ID=MMETSP0014_2-20120614/39781_1 /TAXON_ID=2857 /ORGANISM="Nitzschia sp." /LENGTH=31 /DNA_ID=CAMNT_0000409679 /DNA_START=126 /DNA_END=221 /DNA_ORIENTATION=+ /assembly_acc=CAM_ASM_000159